MSNKATAPGIGNRQEPTTTTEKATYTLAELLAMEVKELPCLFAPIFLKSGIAVLVGGSDTGKSSLLRQMCMNVATGRDFLNWKYGGEHHRAIYFSSEDDAQLTARVVKRYNDTMQLSPEATENLRFVFDYEADTLCETIATMLAEQPADLIIIDAFGDAFTGKNLNDNTEVRKFLLPFKTIAKEANCLIIFNHHTGKRSDERSVSKDNSLGSQAIEAAPRLAIELRQDPTDPDTKHFCVVKANYLPSEYKRKSYAIKMDANLVFATTGERADFAELARPNKPEAQSKKPTAHTNEEHRAFIRSAFDGAELNQTKLTTEIATEFGISAKYAREAYLPYYLKSKWIEETGKKGRNATMYKSMI